jgi:toxin-antitoxin system PIN domain toxin
VPLTAVEVSFTFDANVLLYASDETSARHESARALLAEIPDAGELVYVFWPTVMAYLRISTHPSVFERPLTPADARGNIERLLSLPNVQTAGEQDRFWPAFAALAAEADVRGNLVPDAHLVALMLENGVRTIWTHDRDLRRFKGIEVRVPSSG